MFHDKILEEEATEDLLTRDLKQATLVLQCISKEFILLMTKSSIRSTKTYLQFMLLKLFGSQILP